MPSKHASKKQACVKEELLSNDELLPEFVQAGVTLVVATHNERYLEQLNLPAGKIRMDEGRII